MSSVLTRTLKSGKTLSVYLERDVDGSTIPVAVLDGVEIGRGGEVGWKMISAQGDKTHAAGKVGGAVVVGLTSIEAKKIWTAALAADGQSPSDAERHDRLYNEGHRDGGYNPYR